MAIYFQGEPVEFDKWTIDNGGVLVKFHFIDNPQRPARWANTWTDQFTADCKGEVNSALNILTANHNGRYIDNH